MDWSTSNKHTHSCQELDTGTNVCTDVTHTHMYSHAHANTQFIHSVDYKILVLYTYWITIKDI